MKNYFTDASLINQIKNTLIAEGIIPINITPLSGKSSEPKFKIETCYSIFFAKLSAFNRFDETFRKLLVQNNDFCLSPILSKNVPSINRQLNVYTWLDGENLKTFLSHKEFRSYYEYGVKSGNLLNRLHAIPISNSSLQHNIDESIVELLEFLNSNECKLTCKSFWNNYICENMNILIRNSGKNIVHFDFRPKNIMLSNENLFIVDFDSFFIADPWFDFYDKGLAVYPQKQIFNKGIIDGYFDNKIPSDFWCFFKVLSVYGLVQSAFWTINRVYADYIIDAEQYLLDSYRNFTIDIPVWYDNLTP